MDALPYVDALFKEYLLFRGFTTTLSCFSTELNADLGCGFQAERITQYIFRTLVPGLKCKELIEFLDLLATRFFCHLDSRYEPSIRKLEASILKCFLVTAVTARKPEKVTELFRLCGDDLLSGAQSAAWRPWCALAFVSNPAKDPLFQAYFKPQWQTLLELSFRNFMSEVLQRMPLPAVLRFNTDRRTRLALSQQVDALHKEIKVLRSNVEMAAAAASAAAATSASTAATSAAAAPAATKPPQSDRSPSVLQPATPAQPRTHLLPSPQDIPSTKLPPSAPSPASQQAASQSALTQSGKNSPTSSAPPLQPSIPMLSTPPLPLQPRSPPDIASPQSAAAQSTSLTPLPASSKALSNPIVTPSVPLNPTSPAMTAHLPPAHLPPLPPPMTVSSHLQEASKHTRSPSLDMWNESEAVAAATHETTIRSDSPSTRQGTGASQAAAARTANAHHRHDHAEHQQPADANHGHPLQRNVQHGEPTVASPVSVAAALQTLNIPPPSTLHTHLPPPAALPHCTGSLEQYAAYLHDTNNAYQAHTTSQDPHHATADGMFDSNDLGGEDATSPLVQPPLSSQASFNFETGAQLSGTLQHQDIIAELDRHLRINLGSSRVPSAGSSSDSSSSFLAGVSHVSSGGGSPGGFVGSYSSSPPSAPIPIKKGSSGKWLDVAAESRGITPRGPVPCLENSGGSSSGGCGGAGLANPQSAETPDSSSDGLNGDSCSLATSQLAREPASLGMVISDDADRHAREDHEASGMDWEVSTGVGRAVRRQGCDPMEGTDAEAAGLMGGWRVLEAYSTTPGSLHGNSPVSVCHVSPSGLNVASGAEDGTVAIWRPAGSLGSGSRDARLQCGSSITSLAWDLRADKVMLVGTESSGIRVWHVDTQRIITDVPPDMASPFVCQLACSAHEPMFVCATATLISASRNSHSQGGSTASQKPSNTPLTTARSDPLTSVTGASRQQLQDSLQHQQHYPRAEGAAVGSASGASSGVLQERRRLGRGRLSSWNMRAFKKVSSYSLPEHQEGAATSLALHPHGAWFAATVASPDGLHARPMLHMFDVAGRASLIRSIPLGSHPLSSSPSAYASSGSRSCAAESAFAPAVVLFELTGETCLATAVSSDAFLGGSRDEGDCLGSSSRSGSSTLLQLWSLRKPNRPLCELLLPPPLLQGVSQSPDLGEGSSTHASSNRSTAGHAPSSLDNVHLSRCAGERQSYGSCSLASSPHSSSMAVLRSYSCSNLDAWSDTRSCYSTLTLVDWEKHLKGPGFEDNPNLDGGSFALREGELTKSQIGVGVPMSRHLDRSSPEQGVLSASWPYRFRRACSVYSEEAGYRPTSALTSLSFPGVQMQCVSWHPVADMLMCGCSDGAVTTLVLGR